MKVLIALGTRPEAIKLAPVIGTLSNVPGVEVEVLATAQHRELLDDVLKAFDILPTYDLDVMRPSQTLELLTSRLLEGVTEVLRRTYPDVLVVHGDTTTTMTAALAAFYEGIPIVHVEAGLRTRNLRAPFPEEANRRLVAVLADLHLAPHPEAVQNLLSEGVSPSKISVIGNPGIDALHTVADRIRPRRSRRGSLPKILVTAHRRENLGPRLKDICQGLKILSEEASITYAVHPSPKVHDVVKGLLEGLPNISLIDAPSYTSFVRLLLEADLILTDSGGIQEEALELGVPFLVLRDVTERPEAKAFLVGTDPRDIVSRARKVLASPRRPEPFRSPPSTPLAVRAILEKFG